jgi:hypothetical protein
MSNDVAIDNFSPKLQTRYVAVYRQEVNDRKSLEQAGFTVKISNPYPEEFNTWKNTKFRLFEAKK